MFARVTTYEGPPERMDEGIRIYRDEVIPWLRDATGFRGWMVLLDRDANRAVSLTFWSSAETAADQEATGGALRDELADKLGTAMTSSGVYELEVVEGLALDDPGSSSSPS